MPQNQRTACVVGLLEQVPEVQPLYEEHLRYYGELLDDMFFGDVTRYVVDQVRSGATQPEAPVRRLLSFFEEWLTSGDGGVRDLIGASFVENLLDQEDVIASLREFFGPNLKKQFEQMEEFYQ